MIDTISTLLKNSVYGWLIIAHSIAYIGKHCLERQLLIRLSIRANGPHDIIVCCVNKFRLIRINNNSLAPIAALVHPAVNRSVTRNSMTWPTARIPLSYYAVIYNTATIGILRVVP